MKHLTNSWTLFCGTLLGLIMIMASMRPELQARTGEESGPGKPIAVAGHALTWSTGAVLVYRMVRSVANSGVSEEVRIQSAPDDDTSAGGKPPTEV